VRVAPGTGKTHRSYRWAYAAGELEALTAVVYDFTPAGPVSMHAPSWGAGKVAWSAMTSRAKGPPSLKG